MNWNKNFELEDSNGLLFMVAWHTKHPDFDHPELLEIIENAEEFETAPDELVLNFCAN